MNSHAAAAGQSLRRVLLLALASCLVLAGCVGQRSQPTTTPSTAVADSDAPPEDAPDPLATVGFAETPPAVEVIPLPAPEEMTAADPVSPSPLDRLAEVAPEPTPVALERSRELFVPEEPKFDIPIEMNDRVRGWIDRYSHEHKDSFESGLRRSGRYMERFREIFAEEGVPRDLVYMAHVESGYKTSAYSRAHARGIFQFIAATGRRYGLRVDYWADERADPEKSARAAARYMRDLYAEFGDWYLALAAYNAGEGKIRRAIARTGKRDFWGIARTNYIRRETKNHIPAILAATVLSKDPGKYGLSFEPDPLLRHDTITVDGAADLRVLAKCAGIDVETLRELNPALRRSQTPPGAAFDVHVPLGLGAQTYAALQEIPAKERVLYARHRVQHGDTLSEIARRYGVEVSAIQQANDMGRRTMIRVNQMVLVPTSASTRYADLGPGAPVHAVRGEALVYRVRRGDTLYGIARRHATTADAIAAASGVRVQSVLSVGQPLTVVPGARSAGEARRVALGDPKVSKTARAAGTVYTVQRGDTLWRIANLYRTTVQAICSLNDITPYTTLHPGVRLTVR